MKKQERVGQKAGKRIRRATERDIKIFGYGKRFLTGIGKHSSNGGAWTGYRMVKWSKREKFQWHLFIVQYTNSVVFFNTHQKLALITLAEEFALPINKRLSKDITKRM